MQNFLKTTVAGLVLLAGATAAKADITYTFLPQAATLDGAPVAPVATGSIVLTDAAAASGLVSLAVDAENGTFDSHGIVSLSFSAFGGTPVTLANAYLIDLFGQIDGPFLNIGGSLSGLFDSEQYTSGANLGPTTFLYGTDDSDSPCFRDVCAIGGTFADLAAIPEPGTLPLLLAFVTLGLLGLQRRFGA